MKTYWLAFLLLFVFSACRPNKTVEANDWTSFAKSSGMAPEKEGAIAADFEYTLKGGKKEKLSDNRGKVVFLNFWATWCYPCKKEMPDIEKLNTQFSGRNFRVLAVSAGEGAAKVEPFLKHFPYQFEFAFDENSAISAQYQVSMLPTTLIIGPKGEILGQAIGPRNWNQKDFTDQLEKLIP
ncbi:MAG: hypothetical protein A2527_10865 [Candidatus Lambdaproteobacteria bacterium RIFOXYD2_FULL_50_16]|uniref:Thioredoxin domain-containing protein n=1 Tax=Candidatus Lambdaproteobacteria bacterium RIFOXYD2_FULL_50_16 TaxID=1817772 RepID=A0A1F6GGC5_9PROT|nr:MAG: hypothetical protein A2527_10865 [Candidatus Lambdaproteobacteria bacterium RIFOXYD2_FULL_50_16]